MLPQALTFLARTAAQVATATGVTIAIDKLSDLFFGSGESSAMNNRTAGAVADHYESQILAANLINGGWTESDVELAYAEGVLNPLDRVYGVLYYRLITGQAFASSSAEELQSLFEKHSASGVSMTNGEVPGTVVDLLDFATLILESRQNTW